MRALPLALLSALVVLPLAAEAGARRPQEFQPQDPEVQAAMRLAATGKTKLDSFTETEGPEPQRPIPWLFIGFAVLLLAGTAPFALRAYRNASGELRDAEAARAQQPRPRRRPTGPTA